MKTKSKRMSFEGFSANFPVMDLEEQKKLKGSGTWINGIYVSDYLENLADEHACTADAWDFGSGSGGFDDYGDDDYYGGGGTSSGSGHESSGDQTIDAVMTALSGTSSITGVAVDISKIVDNLSAADLLKLKEFGKKVGAAGLMISFADMAYGVWEEEAFDANDALAVAGMALGAGALIASAPLAVVLGGASLVVGIWASTGAGEDIDLIGGY